MSGMCHRATIGVAPRRHVGPWQWYGVVRKHWSEILECNLCGKRFHSISAEAAHRHADGAMCRKKSVAYAYIRRHYSVEPRVGQRIAMNGKPGVIVRPQGDPQYLRVRFDGQKQIVNVHPTWHVEYGA